MPNAENAILDPFSAMAPTEAIMVAVCGLVVVFLMLAILALGPWSSGSTPSWSACWRAGRKSPPPRR